MQGNAKTREDDQDSAGGSPSSSTGFGSFVRIASASSYIWKKKMNVTHGDSNHQRALRNDGMTSYWHELHVLEEFLYEAS